MPCQQAAHQERAAKQARERDAAAARLVEQGKAKRLVPDPERYPVVHMPAQTRPLTPLSEKRRRAFVAHLDQLLAQSEIPPDAPPPPRPTAPGTLPVLLTPAQEAVSVQGCIGCGGACCQTGSTHAWQDLPSMVQYRRDHPSLSRDEVRAAYLARLGSAPTYADSCVYHGATGCLLPREMRSWRCNTHWCGELREVQRGMAGDERAGVFMVWPRGPGGWRGAFVTAEGARDVDG
ncbi:MAG TPA: hypothetical protein VG692_06110 [Gemmatimonadales bacterium]|nr:hypothetical protein [Gemmatimonadales bacterium]